MGILYKNLIFGQLATLWTTTNRGNILTNSYLKVSLSVRFTKTVGETDVYMFAGITGDLPPNHVDESFMQKTVYGGRIAHGALLTGRLHVWRFDPDY